MSLAGEISGDAADGVPASGACARQATRWFASHELRTPLQAIQGGIEILLEDGGRGLSALQIEAVSLIAEAAASLESCVGQMAELAVLEASRPAALQSVAVGDFLAMPTIGAHLSPRHGIVEAASVIVQVAPDTAARGLLHLTRLARTRPSDTALSPEPAQGLAPSGTSDASTAAGNVRALANALTEQTRLVIDVERVDADEVSFALALPKMASGDGAVARHLALTLLEHAGFAGDIKTGGIKTGGIESGETARLTLRRGCDATT